MNGLPSSCPHCGAALQPPQGGTSFTCPYCKYAMVAEPPRPSFPPQVVQAPAEPRVIVVHHGGPSFFSAYWTLRLGIVALILLGSGGRWAYHHFGGGSRVGQETLDAFDDPQPVAAAAPAPPPPAPAPPPAVVPVHAPAPAGHPAAPPLPPPHATPPPPREARHH